MDGLFDESKEAISYCVEGLKPVSLAPVASVVNGAPSLLCAERAFPHLGGGPVPTMDWGGHCHEWISMDDAVFEDLLGNKLEVTPPESFADTLIRELSEELELAGVRNRIFNLDLRVRTPDQKRIGALFFICVDPAMVGMIACQDSEYSHVRWRGFDDIRNNAATFRGWGRFFANWIRENDWVDELTFQACGKIELSKRLRAKGLAC